MAKEFLLLDEITKNSPSLPQEKDGRASVQMENLTCYWDKVGPFVYTALQAA